MRGIKAILEVLPIVVVWIAVTAMILVAFLHAIGLWPEGWRF